MISRAFSLLPDRIRLPLIRSLFRFDAERTEEIECRLAHHLEDYRQAFGILRRAYGGMGYTLKYRSERLHYTTQHLLPTTNTLVALREGEIIGTMSSVHDSPLGLVGEGQYADWIAERRLAGERIAEGASLAVDAEKRGRGEVLFAIVRYLTLLMMDYEQVDTAVATMIRKRTDLLRALLLFEPLTPRAIPYPGAPEWSTWPTLNDLHTIEERGRKMYGHLPPNRNLAHFVFQVGRATARFPDLPFHTTIGPRLSPEEYADLYGGEGSPLPELDPKSLLALQNALGSELERLFPRYFPVPGWELREVRFEADGWGTIQGEGAAAGDEPVQLRNVSRGGALVRTAAKLRVGEVVRLGVEVGAGKRAVIEGRVVRDAGARRYGLLLTARDPVWTDYIDFLEAWLWGSIQPSSPAQVSVHESAGGETTPARLGR